MAVLAALVQTVIVLFVFTCDIKCEKTADQVYALLDERLNNVAIKIDDIKEEITTQVGAIHQRIDSLETQISSNIKFNEYIEQSDGGSMIMKDVDIELKMKRGLAAEKHFIRRMLKKYQEKFNVFKNNIDDQINAMNDTIVAINVDIRNENKETTVAINNTIQLVTETSKVNLESKLENTTLFINKALNEVKSESDDKLQDYDKLLEEVVMKVVVVERQLKDTVDNRIQAVETKINRRVSFYGWTRVYSSVTQTKLITFPLDNVNRNEGNGYNPDDGKFTAPMAGVYLMQVNVDTDHYLSFMVTHVKCSLYLDGTVISRIESETAENRIYMTSIQYMYGGRKSYVKCFQLSNSRHADFIITFTAILIG